jgi:pyridoxal phosphate enzyme (YggS family)
VTDSLDPETIAANLTAVRERIAEAAAASGRTPESVRLIAVSKTFPAESVRAAIAAGQRDFGENKVQEAIPKIEAIEAMATAMAATVTVTTAGQDAPRDAGDQVRWHLIGHLQSNKARKAARPFDVIHSIDSADLLQRIDAAAREARRTPELLIQVDLAGEATKFGATPDALQPIFDAAASLTNARLVGLMVLPPWSEDPEVARPFFRRLRELRDELGSRGVPAASLRELSMGMSHDFEVAIAEGATMVRVGTAIFGKRTPPAAITQR